MSAFNHYYFKGKQIGYRGPPEAAWVGGYFTFEQSSSIQASAYINDVRVHPESVSAWTGLLDKSGRQIYEGDILSFQILKEEPVEVVVTFRNGSYGFIPLNPERIEYLPDRTWRPFYQEDDRETWNAEYFTVVDHIFNRGVSFEDVEELIKEYEYEAD